ncbi:protein phosphatase 2C domain-containing protein [Actinomadura sp. 3N508]|uniref:protein phosphatase 2C domain-containing protein n=1 Tax=Actinomadura sp. 3N508 TaxID=3375153 RepID=UPI0037A78EE2
MTVPSGTVPWSLLEGSVKGVGKPHSQDHCAARPAVDGQAIVLAVADGHGSKPHFRSDLGARWAVEEFLGYAEGFAEEAVRLGGDRSKWSVLRAHVHSLPQQVVHRWRERVLLHESNSPAHGGRAARSAEDLERVLPVYGSTLLGAVVTEWLLVCWQLGDGDVVLLADESPPMAPLSTGPDIGDETDSLCHRDAWRLMRSHWHPFTGDGSFRGVLMSTDGLSKSFAEHQGFLDFAKDVGDLVVRRGADHVRSELPGWLGQAARYSGDDSTLVGVFAPRNDSTMIFDRGDGTA